MDFDYVVMPALILLIGILVIWLSIRRICSHPNKVSARWKRVTERIALSALVLLAVVVAGSASFNAAALLWFRAHNPPPGNMYAVNGHKMHIDCMGKGSPTIILEAGAEADALIWQTVQPELSKTTRVCSYDRAGYGWSEPQPGPRDADHVADQLRELLLQARVSGPVVLIGHSAGGLYVRDYATRYPASIAGLVIVDGSTPAQIQSSAFKAATAHKPPWLLYRIALILGVPRLLRICSLHAPFLDDHASKAQAEEYFHRYIGAHSGEENSLVQSGEEAAHTGPYGSLPILIFSQDAARSISGPNPPEKAVAAVNEFNQWQEDLKKLSTRSRRIIAKGSGHYIQIDRKDLFLKEVSLFIEQIRGTAAQPTNYGSTITE